jgi:hypothetical protein
MHRIRLFAVLALLLLLLNSGPGRVIAQGPLPASASGIVTTRSSHEEWITRQTEAGDVRVPVTVYEVRVVETVVITPAIPAER